MAQLPTITSIVEQRWFLEPLKGPAHPRSYLSRFPEEVYNVGPDSHLTKFLYVLLGPSGIGFLRQNALEARLRLEEMGLELFDLDRFYGDPLSFTRATDEAYSEDPNGLIDQEAWDKIRAKDAKYRSRILDFLDGVRAGNTPLGMHYAARSGLGHEVSIIENYKALFDERSDDHLGLENYGKTRFLEEMIILPRREVQLSEVQRIAITGEPTGGTFTITFRGETTAAIGYRAPAADIQTFLEALPSIQPGDVEVTGGPAPTGPHIPWRIRFMGRWSAQNTPQVKTTSSLTGGSTPLISSTTEQSGVDSADEIAHISAADRHHLQEAIDRIRPQTVIPTVGEGTGLRARQLWQDFHASSTYDEVVRYAAGNPTIPWPKRDRVHWIESGVEHQAPKAVNDRRYHYESFHNVVAASAFTEGAVEDLNYGTATTPTLMTEHKSSHLGPFNSIQQGVFPFFSKYSVSDRFDSDMIMADYAEPLTVRNIVEDADGTTIAQLINGIYPVSYADLPGVPEIKYDYEQFWASAERPEGTEYIELDLGSVQGVNSLQFEITQKPVDIEISYDDLNQPPRRRFSTAVLDARTSSSTAITFAPENQNPWLLTEYNFADVIGQLIFTRFIRIAFTRRNNTYSPFTIGNDEGFYPWSIDVRNIRVGRNITNLAG